MQCAFYSRFKLKGDPVPADGELIDCLFLKSHEPMDYDKSECFIADRVVLLLRHPYDSAFAEYKR